MSAIDPPLSALRRRPHSRLPATVRESDRVWRSRATLELEQNGKNEATIAELIHFNRP